MNVKPYKKTRKHTKVIRPLNPEQTQRYNSIKKKEAEDLFKANVDFIKNLTESKTHKKTLKEWIQNSSPQHSKLPAFSNSMQRREKMQNLGFTFKKY